MAMEVIPAPAVTQPKADIYYAFVEKRPFAIWIEKPVYGDLYAKMRGIAKSQLNWICISMSRSINGNQSANW